MLSFILVFRPTASEATPRNNRSEEQKDENEKMHAMHFGSGSLKCSKSYYYYCEWSKQSLSLKKKKKFVAELC